MFVLIGLSFFSISYARAETAVEYLNQGVDYFDQGNLPKAIAEYTKAIIMRLNYTKAYYNRGLAYFKEGNFPKAIVDYTKAIEINPNFAHAYYSRAQVYFFTKEYDKAWTDIHKAQGLGAKVDPHFIESLREESGREK